MASGTVSRSEQTDAANQILLNYVLPAYRSGDVENAKAMETLVRAVIENSTTSTPQTSSIPASRPSITHTSLRHSGKESLSDLWNKSKLFNVANPNASDPFNPFLILEVAPNGINVRVVTRLSEVQAYPDDTLVIVHWHGKVYSSDYFIFTVREMKDGLGIG